MSPEVLIQQYGVAHNDIHSNNIMRKYLDGSYILLDFGLAIQDKKAVKSSSRGDGAAEYLPPEKWSGAKIPNEKAVDIYGFGILIYQMLTGRVPFVLDPAEYQQDSLKTLNKVRHQHENEKPADILPLRKAAYEKATGRDDYVKDYPDWLEELVFKCLEKNPEDRFQDAKELQEFFYDHQRADSAEQKKSIEELKLSKEKLEKELYECKNSPDLVKKKRAVIALSIITSLLTLILIGGGYYSYHEITNLQEQNTSLKLQMTQTKDKLEAEIKRLELIIAEKDKGKSKSAHDSDSEKQETTFQIFTNRIKSILKDIF